MGLAGASLPDVPSGGAGGASARAAAVRRAVFVGVVAASFYAGGAILVLRYTVADWLRR